MSNPKCPYCGAESVYVSSAEVYGGRNYGPIYLCRPCKAWVGVHRGTDKPLGRLANSTLRSLKRQAHDAFDPLWRDGWMSRNDAYTWLSKELKVKKAHIGECDEKQCRRVIQASIAKRRRLAKGRDERR
jgi:hypothetical protein